MSQKIEYFESWRENWCQVDGHISTHKKTAVLFDHDDDRFVGYIDGRPYGFYPSVDAAAQAIQARLAREGRE
jgi:hypothetical protein